MRSKTSCFRSGLILLLLPHSSLLQSFPSVLPFPALSCGAPGRGRTIVLPPSPVCGMHRARERRRSYSHIGRPRAWWWCHARDCTTFIITISWHYAMRMLRLDHKVPSNIYPLEHASRRHWRTLFPSHSRWRCETFVKVGTLAPPYAPGRQTQQQSEQEESGRGGERERKGGRVF